MHLSRLEVAHFRGIRHGVLDFDPASTVLIGENDSGRSSLFDLLTAVLKAPEDGAGPFAFSRWDVRCPEEGLCEVPQPIRARLCFVEREPGEWDAPAFEPVRELLGGMPWPRELCFELAASNERHGREVDTWRFTGPAGSRDNDAAQLAWLRALNPLIRIDASASPARRLPLAAHLATLAGTPDQADQLAARVHRHYQQLVEGISVDLPEELSAGFDAALDLLERLNAPGRNGDEAPRHAPMLGELIGNGSGLTPQTFLPPYGNTAYRLGLLLLLGAVLDHRDTPTAPGAEPLLIIEDPEAHLHPMTLSAIWHLIDRIRWQKIVCTHSGDLLASVPMTSLRRLTRLNGEVTVWRVAADVLDRDELRRYSYHVRSHRGVAAFARCWLLVEGETEFWLLPELARLCGYDFAMEGIVCVEFAQCGLPPLVKVAQALGIRWHLLADGDHAGQSYAAAVRSHVPPGELDQHVTVLRQRDIENALWHAGYADVYRRHARLPETAVDVMSPARIITRAIHRTPKPLLALEALDAMQQAGSPGVPEEMRRVIECCVALARGESPVVVEQEREPRSRHHRPRRKTHHRYRPPSEE